jgi:hypothetical protein
MHAVLGAFLTSMRPRTRAAHRAALEELAWQLDGYLRQHPAPRGLQPTVLCRFLVRWYASPGRDAEPSPRRFGAAARVLSRWLLQDTDPRQARRARKRVAGVCRELARADRIATLLAQHAPAARFEAPGPHRDGYWEVVLCGATHAVLRAVGEARLVGPVVFPGTVAQRLRAGVVLNLRLVAAGDCWNVAEYGACYPSAAWLEPHRIRAARA